MSWQLRDTETGRVIHHNLRSQWEICQTSFHRDGSRIKKLEALNMKSGVIIFREVRSKRFIKLPVINDGTLVGEETRTTDIREMHAYTLEKEG